MFKTLLFVVGIPVAWVALQQANAPLTSAEVSQYNAAYGQIADQAARREAAELDLATERAREHAELVARYRKVK